jgi:predicted nucleotidyltransferase
MRSEALAAALRKSARALEEAGVRFLLGGGYASYVRGGPPPSKDVDFMVPPSEREAAVEALEAAGMRIERPPMQWLVKAYDGDELIDVITHPAGMELDDAAFERAERMNVEGVTMPVMAIDDVIATKLWALDEHKLDFAHLLAIARSLRESVDWAAVRTRTADHPYAGAYFCLLADLGIVTDEATSPEGSRVVIG